MRDSYYGLYGEVVRLLSLRCKVLFIHLFLQSRFLALEDEGHLRANKGAFIHLSCEKKTNMMDLGLVTLIGDWEVDPV